MVNKQKRRSKTKVLSGGTKRPMILHAQSWGLLDSTGKKEIK